MKDTVYSKEMGKHVALLTAGHLSSCPRLIKEAELLSENGYVISIVFLSSIPRIADLDKFIIDRHIDWNFYEVKWNKSLSSIFSKLAYELSSIFRFSEKYIQPTSKILIDKTLSIDADLYIAHHPSVLVAAALAAEKYKAKYAYDIEDAFPFVEDGRYINNPEKSIENIERKYINNASFTTTASPLYTNLYREIYGMRSSPMNLLNVFDISDSKIEYKDRRDLQKVSFYWYSQTVGLNRGLDDLFSAVNSLPKNSFEIHIRGMCTDEVREALMNLILENDHKKNIFFHASISADELVERNKEHDIGFALEASASLNRDLCISNKILDYLRSGLFIVATNTQGHQLITNELGENAISYTQGDTVSLSNALNIVLNDPVKLFNGKQKSMNLAREKYNWKIQSRAWLIKVDELL